MMLPAELDFGPKSLHKIVPCYNHLQTGCLSLGVYVWVGFNHTRVKAKKHVVVVTCFDQVLQERQGLFSQFFKFLRVWTFGVKFTGSPKAGKVRQF
jgi:hypothetical protein